MRLLSAYSMYRSASDLLNVTNKKLPSYIHTYTGETSQVRLDDRYTGNYR